MRKTTLIAIPTAVLLLSGAGLAGTSLASASVASPAHSAASGTEHFYLMTTQASAARYTVIATGVFTAGGVDISGNKIDTVKLTGGGFKINHGGVDHVITQQINPRTCLAKFVVSGKFTVFAGTGAYKGISGSGKALVDVLAIGARKNGQCNMNANPAFSEETITATAHVTL
jgi:hypothetical protein